MEESIKVFFFYNFLRSLGRFFIISTRSPSPICIHQVLYGTVSYRTHRILPYRTYSPGIVRIRKVSYRTAQYRTYTLGTLFYVAHAVEPYVPYILNFKRVKRQKATAPMARPPGIYTRHCHSFHHNYFFLKSELK
jgi:hypothetical protein